MEEAEGRGGGCHVPSRDVNDVKHENQVPIERRNPEKQGHVTCWVLPPSHPPTLGSHR